ncbi:MAG: SRPBCC family protein [Chloroflexales bacterium]|nr:SRPBCC family protein [Chloroflexales bacterium]
MGIYTFSAAITTTVAPERIWATLDDIAGWPRWMPGTQGLRVEPQSAGAVRAGYRFRLRAALLHANLEVRVCGPLERTTAFQISFPPFGGVNACRLVPLDGGAHRLERVDELHIPDMLGSWLSTTQRARFEQLAVEFLAALEAKAKDKG